MKGARVGVRGKILPISPPFRESAGAAAYQLPYTPFTLRGADLPVKIFRDHDIGRCLRPVFWNFYVFLLEQDFPLLIHDRGGSGFPFDVIVGRYSFVRKMTGGLDFHGLFDSGLRV